MFRGSYLYPRFGLACDATVVGIVEGEDGEPLDVGRKTRSIPPAIARALRARDGGCRFPGCDRTRWCDGHHAEHWANGGETKLHNLVTLCGFHHRLVHEGGYGVKRTDDGLFIFTRPDGTRIEDNGQKCFRGNILLPLQSTYRGFEHSLRDYLTKRPDLEDHARNQPLRMARREHGLQSGNRSHAVPRAQGC